MQPWKQQNKNHWNAVGSSYAQVWEKGGKPMLSNQETAYIASVARSYRPTTALDIGCGTGRILDIYTRIPSVHGIYGIDIAEAMVEHCKHRFRSQSIIRDIVSGDIEEKRFFQHMQFDMVSCIRVLKYNSTWTNMISNITSYLAPHGILVCTMPNIHSVTSLSRDPVHYTTPNQFASTLEHAGLRVIDMRGFSKLPDILHSKAMSSIAIRTLHHTEQLLETMVGPTLGARILFVTCQKV